MAGRWPANVILSPAMARVLDQQSGYQRDGVAVKRGVASDADRDEMVYKGGWKDGLGESQTYGSGGGASRFFLNAGYEPWELDWIYANGLRPCGTE